MDGFTLLELVIVILILGILAGLAQPLMASSMVHARLNAATSEVVTALRFGRAVAINTGNPCKIVFDPGAETVDVQQLVPDNLAMLKDTALTQINGSDVDDPANWSYVSLDYPLNPSTPYHIDFLADSRFSGIDIVSAAFGGTTEVIFDGTGGADNDGSVAIQLAGRDGVIAVNGQTGAMQVSIQ